LSLPADQRQGDDEHNGDKKSDPSFDFVGTSHLYIINVNIVYMMIAGSGTFPLVRQRRSLHWRPLRMS